MRALLPLLLLLLGGLATACSGPQGEIEDLNGGDPGTENPGGGGGTDTGPGGLPGDETGPGGPVTPEDGKVGKGGLPFDPKGEGSSGVKLDPDGSVVIDPGAFTSSSAPIIWVANSAEGTVSKVDTRTMKEVARYRTGPGSPDPSRTTVGLNGDVVVVNRGGASATKIAVNEVDCTGPGGGTSKGPTDLRAWGDDKCVLWNTPFEPGSLGRAGAFDAEKGIDGSLSTSVWVGLWTLSKMVQLDSKTGKILAEVSVAPLKPYGAAVDADHNVWVWGGGVGKIFAPTKTFTKVADPPCAYGIAVDPKGRVWTSGGGCVARYNPATNLWDKQSVGKSNRGLAVDAKGSVWIADTQFGVHQLDMESMAVVKSLPLSDETRNFVGMAIDFDGMVWSVNLGGSEAFKIDPKTYATTVVKVGKGPYTYSDMTGFQLRNAAAPFGKYLHTFKGCGAQAKWVKLSWSAITPSGTTITVRARVGSDAATLAAAPWKVVAKVPGDTPPVDIGAALGADGSKGLLMQVEFLLQTPSAATTPILSSIEALSTCPPAIN